MKVIALDAHDIRFPTSRELDGSDAMNPDPDYSAAYVVLRTDDGRGRARVRVHHRPRQRGVRRRDRGVRAAGRRPRHSTCRPGRVRRRLVHDSQLRWLGPEKGVVHMATSAVVNARSTWPASVAGKPLWRLLAEHVARADRRPGRLPLPHRRAHPGAGPRPADGRPRRARPSGIAHLLSRGYPAYTTSPGWLGYADDKLRRLCQGGRRGGLHPDQAEGRRRPGRTTCGACGSPARRSGADIRIAIDANQRWDVAEAIDWVEALEAVRPVVDRGADQPRRRARARRHPQGASRPSGSPPVSTSPTG